MKSIKKRMVTLLTVGMLLAATAVPAFAQDNPEPTPGPDNGLAVEVIIKQIGGPHGWTMQLSIPVRCGNNC